MSGTQELASLTTEVKKALRRSWRLRYACKPEDVSLSPFPPVRFWHVREDADGRRRIELRETLDHEPVAARYLVGPCQERGLEAIVDRNRPVLVQESRIAQSLRAVLETLKADPNQYDAVFVLIPDVQDTASVQINVTIGDMVHSVFVLLDRQNQARRLRSFLADIHSNPRQATLEQHCQRMSLDGPWHWCGVLRSTKCEVAPEDSG